jgi:hypothetical protein
VSDQRVGVSGIGAVDSDGDDLGNVASEREGLDRRFASPRTISGAAYRQPACLPAPVDLG